MAIHRVHFKGIQRVSLRRQQGFSLVEVSIVTAIVLLLAIIGIPAIGTYVIENKVPKVGESLARFVVQTKVNAPTSSTEPYADIETSHLANLVRDSSIFSVRGTAATPTILHGLGREGEVSVASADSGASFAVTLSKVNHAACPSLASVMQRVADEITLQADGQGSVIIKDESTPYSALAVESYCQHGDANTFVFIAS